MQKRKSIPRKKFTIISKTFDKKGRQLSVGLNSYSKSNPIMQYLGNKVGIPEKIYLHAEVQSLLRCKDKKPYKLTVERYDSEGNMAMSKPCPICSEALKMFGVSIVKYTTKDGWVEEKL